MGVCPILFHHKNQLVKQILGIQKHWTNLPDMLIFLAACYKEALYNYYNNKPKKCIEYVNIERGHPKLFHKRHIKSEIKIGWNRGHPYCPQV